jgi:hypothetical protein
MVRLQSKEFHEIAPLAVALNPVTIFYIFFGTNHIVMLCLLLIAIYFFKKEQWLLVGLFSAFAIYKYLLIPTIVLLCFILYLRYNVRKVFIFCAGFVIGLLPNLWYCSLDLTKMLHTINHLGAVGSQSHHIEPFHFLYIFNTDFPFLQDWYVFRGIWFVLTIAATFLVGFLYYRKRLTSLQALGISAAFVALFSLEPFRLEPALGLLWLDAVYRKDTWLKQSIIAVIWFHILGWYPRAYPHTLEFLPIPQILLWNLAGFLLGLSVLFMTAVVLLNKSKTKNDLLFPSIS